MTFSPKDRERLIELAEKAGRETDAEAARRAACMATGLLHFYDLTWADVIIIPAEKPEPPW